MADLETRIRTAAGLAPVVPDLARVAGDVRSRRRRRRAAVAGATALVLTVLAAGVVAVRGGNPESQQVVTGPDGRTLTEPVGTWRQAADPPFDPRTQAFTATTDDGRILVWGGYDDESQVDWQLDGGIYDPETDQWTAIPKAPLSADATYASASLVHDRLAVVDGEGRPVTAAVFDLNDETWTELPAPGIDGVFSGPAWDGTTMALFRIWPSADGGEAITLRWSRGQDRWSRGRPYPHGPRSVPAIARDGERFAVWGGTTSDIFRPTRPSTSDSDAGATSDGAVYDLESDTWQDMPPGPLEPRMNADAIWQGGSVIVGAGQNGLDDSQTPLAPIIARYDPATTSWHQLPFPADSEVMADWNGTQAPAFFLERTASDAITVVGEAGMHSGTQPRWFTLGDEWEQAPFYDLHELDVGLVATSATRDNPDDGAFQLAVRVAPGVWLDGAEGPFTNRMEPAVGTAGDHVLVVGGREGRNLDPVGDAWVFDVSE